MAVFPGGVTVVFCQIRTNVKMQEVVRQRFALGLGGAVPVEWLDLHVAELDPPALGLEPDMSLLDLAVVPLVGDRAVDPERHVRARGR